MMGHLRNVAKTLKISSNTVTANLKSGQSLATIAQRTGSSAAILETTLLQDAKSQIQNAVATDHLTSAQTTRIESRLTPIIDNWVVGR